MSYTVISARLDFGKSINDLLKARNLEKGGKVQQAIDNSVIAWNMRYVPWKTGTLAKSPYRGYTPGKVVYEGPYARYLYYGEVMGPNIPIFDDDSGEPTRFYSPPGQPKHLTGRKLKYDTSTNPLAGSFWNERMKADHMNDILTEAKRYAGIK